MDNKKYKNINRKKTRKIFVGNVAVGGDALISVQSMTNTLTTDVQSTVNQIRQLEDSGVDIVRVSCPDKESTESLSDIIKSVKVPIVADIHFHYKRAIEAADAGAACLRINPGNIGSNDRVKEVIKAAKNNNCSIRIGVNAGSLEKKILEQFSEPNPDALVASALSHARILEDNDFTNFKISVKASDVFMAMSAYKKLSEKCDYPLHLGITEAGGAQSGTVKSAIGIGQMLLQGVGDTIRVSLSANPVEEVKVAFEILRSLDIRHKGVRIVSCPSCARQGFDVIKTVELLEKRLSHISEPISLSIIGCVVNGPGEARMTDFGLTGGGGNSHKMYISGIADHNINDKDKIDHIVKLIEKKASDLKSKSILD